MGMNVRELIAELQTMPQDAPVVVEADYSPYDTIVKPAGMVLFHADDGIVHISD